MILKMVVKHKYSSGKFNKAMLQYLPDSWDKYFEYYLFYFLVCMFFGYLFEEEDEAVFIKTKFNFYSE